MEKEYEIALLYEAIKGYEPYVYVNERWLEINFGMRSPILHQYLMTYSAVPMKNLVRLTCYSEWSIRHYYFDEKGIVRQNCVTLKPKSKSAEELVKYLRDCIEHNVEIYKIVLERSQEYGKALMVKKLEDI